ncbi:MAG: winged helix-turn-helix domain-containing protein [Halobacterium sp.]
MAIPHWTWPGDDRAATADELAAATGAFDALSDPTRAAVLGALYDADRPLAYAEVAEAAGVEDNGRLNYHLRQLDGLIERSQDGYVLSSRGRALVDGARTAAVTE